MTPRLFHTFAVIVKRSNLEVVDKYHGDTMAEVLGRLYAMVETNIKMSSRELELYMYLSKYDEIQKTHIHIGQLMDDQQKAEEMKSILHFEKSIRACHERIAVMKQELVDYYMA